MINCCKRSIANARRISPVAATAVVLALFCQGCGEPNNPLAGASFYPVKGRILLADGKPLPAGRIVFASTKSTTSSTAPIESDGSFTFKSSSGDGLPEGEYKIRIEPTTSGKTKGTMPFPGMYADEDQSGLKATVTTDESKNNFEFKLEAKDPAPQSKRGVDR
jgi:hypothetical protein